MAAIRASERRAPTGENNNDGENNMKKPLGYITALLLTTGSFTAYAQDDGPVGFTYGTYYVCDVASQGDMDDIVTQYEKPVFDKWVEDGKLIAWGYLSHFTGGRWRRAQYHVSPTLADAVNTQATIFQEIYGDNNEAGARRSEACEAHDDYVWAIGQGSGPGTDRGEASLSVYYVCDQNRQLRADDIIRDYLGPKYDQLVEDGKLASWGWSSHVLGGEYRRLGTMTGANYEQILAARGEIIEAMRDEGNPLADEFNDICPTHSDYLWDIVHEAN